MLPNRETSVGESRQADLAARWEAHFPGDTPVLEALRQEVIYADHFRLRLHTELQRLQRKLDLTGFFREEYPAPVLHFLIDLETRRARAGRNFTRALQALQVAFSAHQVSEKIRRETEPYPEEKGSPIPIAQNVTVRLVEGKVVTEAAPASEFVWDSQPWPDGAPFYRDFFFPDAVVPGCYAYVLTHEGVTHQPTRFVSLHYSQQEFLRLCKLEMDTRSDFVLDGERIGATRKD